MEHAVELTRAFMKCSLRVCELVFFGISAVFASIVHIDFHPTCTFGSSSIADSWLKNAEDIHEEKHCGSSGRNQCVRMFLKVLLVIFCM